MELGIIESDENDFEGEIKSCICENIKNEDLLLHGPPQKLMNAICSLIESGKAFVSDTEINASARMLSRTSHYMKIIHPNNSADKNPEYTRDKIIFSILQNRIMNKICRNCLLESKKKILGHPWLVCDKCFQIFYCSAECRDKNSKEHNEIYCCKKDGPLENALLLPLRIFQNIRAETNELGDFTFIYTMPPNLFPEEIRKIYGERFESAEHPKLRLSFMSDIYTYLGAIGLLKENPSIAAKKVNDAIYIVVTYRENGVLLKHE